MYRFEGDPIEESSGGQGRESGLLMFYSKWVGKVEVEGRYVSLNERASSLAMMSDCFCVKSSRVAAAVVRGAVTTQCPLYEHRCV